MSRSGMEIDMGWREQPIARGLKCLVIGGGRLDLAIEVAELTHASDAVKRFIRGVVAVTPGDALATIQPSRQFLASDLVQSGGMWDWLVSTGSISAAPLQTLVGAELMGIEGEELAKEQDFPLRQLNIESGIVPRKKVGFIVVVTTQWMQAAGPEAETLLSNVMGLGLAVTADWSALQAIISSATIEVSASTSDDFGTLLGRMFAAIDSGVGSKIVLAVEPRIARDLAGAIGPNGPKFPAMTAGGGTIGSLPVRVTSALEVGEMVLFDARQVLGGNEGGIEFAVSGEADVQMSSAPTPGPAAMSSMFMNNSIAIRAMRTLGAKLLNPNAVVKAIGVPTTEFST
jgi:hypothetical protein